MVRIANSVREHRKDGVGTDRVFARELDEAAARIATHAVRLVGLADARRLANQAGVDAEHEPLRGGGIDGSGRAGAHERGGEPLELGLFGIAAIGDQPAEPAGLARGARLGRPAGVRHGRRARRTRQACGLAPERQGLRADREHLRGGIARRRLVRCDRIGEHCNRGARRWRRASLHRSPSPACADR
jgi:hypothetical protein